MLVVGCGVNVVEGLAFVGVPRDLVSSPSTSERERHDETGDHIELTRGEDVAEVNLYDPAAEAERGNLNADVEADAPVRADAERANFIGLCRIIRVSLVSLSKLDRSDASRLTRRSKSLSS